MADVKTIVVKGRVNAVTVGRPGPPGAKGDTGAQGEGVNVLGVLPAVEDLPTPGPATGGYVVAGDYYIYVDDAWENVGPFQGPQGIQGVQGPAGADAPPWLTSDQEAAITGAATPSASNVFATANDLPTTPEEVGAEPADAAIQGHLAIVAGNPHGTTASDIGAEPADAAIQGHLAIVAGNPHGTNASDVGAEPADAAIQSHLSDTNNPHYVTASQVGAEPTLTGATADTNPADTDTVYGGNAGSSFATIKTTWSTIKTFLASTFATVAQVLGRKVYHGLEVAGTPYVSEGNLIIPLVGGEIIYWFAGTKYRTTTQISIPLGTLTADAQYYVYFTDDAATAVVSATPWGIDYTKVQIATVTWNGSTGFEVGTELHAYDRDLKWHRSAHKSYGAQYENGGAISSAASTFSIEAFSTWDEDINNATAGATTSARVYTRKNASSDVTFGDTLRNYLYRWGAGDGVPQYDDGDGTPADVSTSRYGVYWIYFTNDAAAPLAVIMGRGNYSTVALAQAELKPALPNRTTAEWRLAYKVYYRNVAGTATYQSSLTEDYRAASTGPATAGGVTSLPASSITYVPTTPDASSNVQTALDARPITPSINIIRQISFGGF